jgi:hypothetical protein
LTEEPLVAKLFAKDKTGVAVDISVLVTTGVTGSLTLLILWDIDWFVLVAETLGEQGIWSNTTSSCGIFLVLCPELTLVVGVMEVRQLACFVALHVWSWALVLLVSSNGDCFRVLKALKLVKVLLDCVST